MTEENLVIVESPAKAKTIEKFLGSNFLVKSSFGHIRDLEKKGFGVDVENHYAPQYVISEDKKKVVAELKKLSREAQVVWIASDEDREGEAIAWHLMEVLKLNKDKTKRIVFHEITKDAILHAIDNPRELDSSLVDAQQARRVLDRLVGFEVSPVLWKKVKPSLSAGRVQSVAVRLIVEREREINHFQSTSAYRISAVFQVKGTKGENVELKAELPHRFEKYEEAFAFLEKCKGASFSVENVITKPTHRTPAPPFTTSTLQQEASRKLGYSVSQTMSIAQRLYEAGKITYMRTDSVNLSQLAINTAKKVISEKIGEKYVHSRQYKTKTKGAQEAHEAIRPTYLENETIGGTSQEKRLYDLIWKRAIASQMSDAELEKTTVTIHISTAEEKFVATGEVLRFDGFLRVYMESNDEETNDEQEEKLLPPLAIGDSLSCDRIDAVERFSLRPPRYTEASLVRKLEELGIGRPSTYAPIITTIQQRGYVVKEDRDGVERNYRTIGLKGNTIKEEIRKEVFGTERSKLFPTDIGIVVNDYLIRNFEQVMDFNFTAKVEKQFDEIAEGHLIWNEMIDEFYKPFHKTVEKALNSDRVNSEKILGTDPVSGKRISVKIGKFGPLVQLGEKAENETDEKPRFASLNPGMSIETITLDEALKLFSLPRELGEYEEKKVSVAIGRFGPYVRFDNKFVSLQKNVDDPYTITRERAVELIEAKREKDRNAVILIFEEEPELRVLNGRWGPYISYKKENYKIPKETDPHTLSLDDCKKLIADSANAPRRNVRKTRKTAGKGK